MDSTGVVKLSDFGCSKEYNENSLSRSGLHGAIRGTIWWMAPEALKGTYTKAVDIWSLGCLIIEMATGRPPWENLKGESDFLSMKYIVETDKIPNIPEWLSDDCRDFIRLCLNRLPESRPSCEELLKHPFVRDQMIAEPAGTEDPLLQY